MMIDRGKHTDQLDSADKVHNKTDVEFLVQNLPKVSQE